MIASRIASRIPTSTRMSVELEKAVPQNAEAVGVFIAEGGKAPAAGLSAGERKAVAALVASGVARGKPREVSVAAVEHGKGKLRRVLVVGLGKPEKINAEALRVAAGALGKALRKARIKRAAVVLPELKQVNAAAAADSIATGLLLASFRYEEYKGSVSRKKKEEDETPGEVRVALVGDGKHLKEALDRAVVIAQGQNFARTIAWRPGNDINPPALAKVVQEMAREVGLRVSVLDEKEMKRLGMGGILAVGAGSEATPPRMIVLEHGPVGARHASPSGRKSKQASRAGHAPPLLVVGKAITFDTGGISIKPAEKMGKMIFDKCGGMAVLGLMYALAKLKWPAPVVGILASAENHISGDAYRPGDVLRMYNGVTVEVTNTDAEGRLVLGDALAWGIEQYQPRAVVDLATLTGGVVVALGKTMAGVMSNNDALVGELQKAADRAGEKFWRLPLGDEQREQIKSEPADIVNSAGREAHPLQGGAFLSHFVPDDLPWAHLDIAGVADTEKELPYYGKGATGWGVRTLVEWVTSRADK